MNLTKIIILYLLTVPVLFVIDMVWLGIISKNFYKEQLGHLFGDSINWPPVIFFYLLFVVGILVFCVLPVQKEDSLQKAIILGALFGLFTYSTYDLTNFATLKNWPFTVVLVDIVWGIVLSGTVSAVSFLISKLVTK